MFALESSDKMTKSTFFLPFLELVMSTVHFKIQQKLSLFTTISPQSSAYVVLIRSLHRILQCFYTMLQVNKGRVGTTAPTFTSDEPMEMFQCCVTILDWQKTPNPQELCKYIFRLLAFKHSSDTPKVQRTNAMPNSFSCMLRTLLKASYAAAQFRKVIQLSRATEVFQSVY